MPLNPAMKCSQQGIDAIKRREGFRATAYPDASGYSIGYGHFGVSPDATCTEEQAQAWLEQDIGGAESAINGHVNVQLTQNQFDALCSFIYNVGVGAFESSTLLRILNSGYQGLAGNQFSRWVFSGGHENPALEARRRDEQAQFEGKQDA